jgi:hypothetical protein
MDQYKPEASGETGNVHISSSPQSRSTNVMDLSHFGCQLQLKIKWKSYIVNKTKKIA